MGEKIATKDAKGKVVNVNILSREVDVEDSEGRVIKVKM
jgi:cell fate regulator YaaT (PSP1 superfamily)